MGQAASTKVQFNRDVGGPSVKPYQPAGYYANIEFPSRDYVADTDSRQWRRGLYMHWQRTFLHPMLANFDAPMRDECNANRPLSNTPQQALTLLNDPIFVEAARVFAARLLNEKSLEDAARINRAFENIVDVHDLYATMLHQLGIDHKRMTVKFQGLDMRLTGIAGKLVKGIIS